MVVHCGREIHGSRASDRSQLRCDRPRKQCLWRSDKTSCIKPRKILALLMLLGLDRNLETCVLTFQAALMEELPDSAIQEFLFRKKRLKCNRPNYSYCARHNLNEDSVERKKVPSH